MNQALIGSSNTSLNKRFGKRKRSEIHPVSDMNAFALQGMPSYFYRESAMLDIGPRLALDESSDEETTASNATLFRAQSSMSSQQNNSTVDLSSTKNSESPTEFFHAGSRAVTPNASSRPGSSISAQQNNAGG